MSCHQSRKLDLKCQIVLVFLLPNKYLYIFYLFLLTNHMTHNIFPCFSVKHFKSRRSQHWKIILILIKWALSNPFFSPVLLSVHNHKILSLNDLISTSLYLNNIVYLLTYYFICFLDCKCFLSRYFNLCLTRYLFNFRSFWWHFSWHLLYIDLRLLSFRYAFIPHF